MGEILDQLQSSGISAKSLKNAEKYINEIGFFKLVKGYRKPFGTGTDIEDLFRLYSFDKALKELLLKFLCTIEVAVKAQLSKFMTKQFGFAPRQYLNSKFYQDIKSPKGIYEFSKCKEKIKRTIEKNRNHRCLRHYSINNMPLPFSALAEVLSFGDINSLYTHMLPLYQSQISKYWGVSHKFLKSALDVMRMFRNACAHNEVIYDYKTMGFNLRAREISEIYNHFNIKSNNGKYETGTDNLLAIFFIFKTMLLKERFNEFIAQYKSIIKDLHRMKNPDALDRITKILSIPNNIDELLGL